MKVKVTQDISGAKEYFESLGAYMAVCKRSASEIIRKKAVSMRIRLLKSLGNQALVKGQAEQEARGRNWRLALKSKRGKEAYEANKNLPKNILLTRLKGIGVDADKVKNMPPQFMARLLANKKELASRNSSGNYLGGSLSVPGHNASKLVGSLLKNGRTGRQLTAVVINAQETDETPEVVLINDAFGMKKVLMQKSILSSALQAESADMTTYVQNKLNTLNK